MMKFYKIRGLIKKKLVSFRRKILLRFVAARYNRNNTRNNRLCNNEKHGKYRERVYNALLDVCYRFESTQDKRMSAKG